MIGDLLIWLVGALTGGGFGAYIARIVVETRHDCLPHDPLECRK